MSDSPDTSAADPIPIARRTILPYQGVLGHNAVTLRRFYDPFEAPLYANALAAHGIDYYLMNQNAHGLGAWGGTSRVELQVREDDLPIAGAALAQFHANPLEVEPAEDSDASQPIPDPSGEGHLVAAAAYDNPRRLFDAASTLGAAHVQCFLPLLVPRGDRPPGEGNRFVVWVRDTDAERARHVLTQADAEQAADDEPRCPKCGSYRVELAPAPWPGLFQFLFGRRSDVPRQMRCFRCRERWTV